MEHDDNIVLMWADIDTFINQLYDYYETTYENKQSSSSSKNRRSSFSCLLSASKRSRTSYTLNKLHYYIQRVATPEIDPHSGFDSFDILA